MEMADAPYVYIIDPPTKKCIIKYITNNWCPFMNAAI